MDTIIQRMSRQKRPIMGFKNSKQKQGDWVSTQSLKLRTAINNRNPFWAQRQIVLFGWLLVCCLFHAVSIFKLDFGQAFVINNALKYLYLQRWYVEFIYTSPERLVSNLSSEVRLVLCVGFSSHVNGDIQKWDSIPESDCSFTIYENLVMDIYY